MAAQNCIDAVKAVAPELSTKELDELFTNFYEQRDNLLQSGKAGDLEEASVIAADRLKNLTLTNALLEKRNAALNAKRKAEAVKYIKRIGKDNPALGLEAYMMGVNNLKQGSRSSIATIQMERRGYYLSGIIEDLEAGNLTEALASGSLDRDISRALWLHDSPANLQKLDAPKEAKEIAKILHKWQAVTRLDLNKAGANIGDLRGYITRDSHASDKIMGAGFDTWSKHLMGKLDWERMADDIPDLSREEYLRKVYHNIITGRQFMETAEDTGFKGPANLAKKVSRARVLHFISADAWFDYNLKYGTGNLRESVLSNLSNAARNVGLLKTLGTNPEANLNSIMDSIRDSLKHTPEKIVEFDKHQAKFENYLKTLDGRSDIPANEMFAKVSANTRAMVTLAKMGTALASQFSDIALYGSEMKYQGKGYLSSLAGGIAGLLRGRGSAEQRAITSDLGVYFDSAMGEIANRFSTRDQLSGKMSRLMGMFFKINCMNWWTDTMKTSAGLTMSHHAGRQVGTNYNKLGGLERALTLHGIDEGKWDLLKSVELKGLDGKKYLTPEAIRSLPTEEVRTYLAAQGLTASPIKIAEFKEEYENQLRAFFVDRMSFAVLAPDAKTKAIMQQGTQPGTVYGELLRFMGQFKSFTVASLQKPVGREVYGYGDDTLGAALSSGSGTWVGIAQIIGFTTLFGYGSMVIKDALKNRTPQDPTDYKTWVSAMAQGGGLGIYGDFLFGQTNRYGGGFAVTALGPVIGSANDLHSAYAMLKEGDPEGAGAKTLKLAIQNTPFVNLFYVKPALDYLILNQINESLSPGYIRRQKRMLEKQGQNYIIPPK